MDGESQNAQNARVEKLWQKLDTRNEGHLDIIGLKTGLKKINHPLQNADTLLEDVLKVVDTNRDGRIQYSEFRTFVEQTEKELWQLFQSIDRDHNGQLDKAELQMAFSDAGLRIPKPKLDQFFSEVDTNNDGAISFDEWRNFLLFIPAQTPGLKAVLSYYSATMKVNQEGDVHVTNENVQGLGRDHFLKKFFGTLFAITKPPQASKANLPSTSSVTPVPQVAFEMESRYLQPSSFPWDPGEEDSVIATINMCTSESSDELRKEKKAQLLTDLLPHPGYFVAGGIAGVVSRTATAPLDRLKVYLIAQTGVRDKALEIAKSGSPLRATKVASRPLVEASKQLWQMGGIRSLFAGNGLNVLKIMPESAIKFGAYEGAKGALARLEGHDDPKSIHKLSRFFAGGFGGVVSQFFIYPIDTLKFRLQCETVKGGLQGNALIADTARKMWATSGFRSFYCGLPLGLIGVFPYSAIDFSTFEYLKDYVTARNIQHRQCHKDNAAPGNIMTAGIGAFSGALGASLVFPINVIRTRLQTQGTVLHPPTYNGVVDVTMKTIHGEGIRGLFKGLTPNLLKVVPAVSITYVVYDNSKKVLGLQ